MINTEIKESDWKDFEEMALEPQTPYWFKMENGNVVLAVHLTTKFSSGWAKATFDEEMKLAANGNEFYMLKGAKVQEALIN